MAKLKVDAGACGFMSTVEVRKGNNGSFELLLESECEMVQRLAERLRVLSTEDLSNKRSQVFKEGFQCLRHISCPLPIAILKALEVEAGFNVPRDVKIEFEK
jgi:hypothetical protein